MPGRMAPRRKDEHRVEIDPAWCRALAKRAERLGLGTVQREAGIGRMTLWRLLTEGQRGTVDSAERVRQAVMALDPTGEPIPPPPVVVRKLR